MAWRAPVHGVAKSCTWLSNWTELNVTYISREFVGWVPVNILELVYDILHFYCLVDKSCPVLLWPCGLLPTRLLCPWNFPGENTGMGCHFLRQESSWSRDQMCVSCLHYWYLGSLPQSHPHILYDHAFVFQSKTKEIQKLKNEWSWHEWEISVIPIELWNSYFIIFRMIIFCHLSLKWLLYVF